MSGFQSAKLWALQLFGLPRDALHIYVGLAVFLAAAAVSRRSLGHWLPLAAAVAAAAAGEAWDLLDTVSAGRPPLWASSWHDLWNTAFWPFVLFLLARYSPVLKR
jgi:cell shape-determining protein MreD